METDLLTELATIFGAVFQYSNNLEQRGRLILTFMPTFLVLPADMLADRANLCEAPL